MKRALFLVMTFLYYCPIVNSQSEIVKTIYFSPNSYSIDKKYHKALDEVARQIRADSFSYLKIFGYADQQGPEEYNDILSGKRAEAVYQYLLSRSGFDTTRVYVTWIGESADAYDLHFPTAHVQQRCVDVWVVFYRKPG